MFSIQRINANLKTHSERPAPPLFKVDGRAYSLAMLPFADELTHKRTQRVFLAALFSGTLTHEQYCERYLALGLDTVQAWCTEAIAEGVVVDGKEVRAVPAEFMAAIAKRCQLVLEGKDAGFGQVPGLLLRSDKTLQYFNRELRLADYEYQLLLVFEKERTRPLHACDIAKGMSKPFVLVSEESVRSYITRLRKRMGRTLGQSFIRTHKSAGYCIAHPRMHTALQYGKAEE